MGRSGTGQPSTKGHLLIWDSSLLIGIAPLRTKIRTAHLQSTTIGPVDHTRKHTQMDLHTHKALMQGTNI